MLVDVLAYPHMDQGMGRPPQRRTDHRGGGGQSDMNCAWLLRLQPVLDAQMYPAQVLGTTTHHGLAPSVAAKARHALALLCSAGAQVGAQKLGQGVSGALSRAQHA